MTRFLRTKADEPKGFELSALDRERTPPKLGVAETNARELIEQADGVAGNSTGRRANALSLTSGLFSANAEGGLRNASLGCKGRPWRRHDQGFFPIRGTPHERSSLSRSRLRRTHLHAQDLC